LPPEFAGRADDYITEICANMLPALVKEGLVDSAMRSASTSAFARTD
jgi:hypothetical protein